MFPLIVPSRKLQQYWGDLDLQQIGLRDGTVQQNFVRARIQEKVFLQRRADRALCRVPHKLRPSLRVR
jgi:hypothetical protein